MGAPALPTEFDEDKPRAGRVGDVVGARYELERVLGTGATGVVWLAKHLTLTTQVAVKLVDPEALLLPGAGTVLERFRYEAQVCARIGAHTENLVMVLDAGKHESLPFIVMEYAPGDSLEARIERGPMSPAEVSELLGQLGAALDVVHDMGIAHRDIKPANILCATRQGATVYKLADFGLAKSFGSVFSDLKAPKKTQDAALVGTPAYMAPEYLAYGGTTSGAGDVWALAVVAYEALTQALPFDAGSVQSLAAAVWEGVFEPPSKLRPELGEALDAFFVRALARDPAARITSGGELAREFDAALERAAARLVVTEKMASARPPSVVPSLALPIPAVPQIGGGHEQFAPTDPAPTQSDEWTDDAVVVEAQQARRSPLAWVGVVIGAAALLGGGLWWLLGSGAAPTDSVASSSRPAASAAEVDPSAPTAVTEVTEAKAADRTPASPEGEREAPPESARPEERKRPGPRPAVTPEPESSATTTPTSGASAAKPPRRPLDQSEVF